MRKLARPTRALGHIPSAYLHARAMRSPKLHRKPRAPSCHFPQDKHHCSHSKDDKEDIQGLRAQALRAQDQMEEGGVDEGDRRTAHGTGEGEELLEVLPAEDGDRPEKKELRRAERILGPLLRALRLHDAEDPELGDAGGRKEHERGAQEKCEHVGCPDRGCDGILWGQVEQHDGMHARAVVGVADGAEDQEDHNDAYEVLQEEWPKEFRLAHTTLDRQDVGEALEREDGGAHEEAACAWLECHQLGVGTSIEKILARVPHSSAEAEDDQDISAQDRELQTVNAPNPAQRYQHNDHKDDHLRAGE
mmetsp:Transcript_126501/g.404990  ORF Transcript_126501/g.404990 Transcript_126501/m.404990 type:complete len:305 (+) Transcript_126501:17-931(+)